MMVVYYELRVQCFLKSLRNAHAPLTTQPINDCLKTENFVSAFCTATSLFGSLHPTFAKQHSDSFLSVLYARLRRRKINDLNLRFPHLHFQRISLDFQECEIVSEAEGKIDCVGNDPRSFSGQCKFGQSFVTEPR